jgi:hypothetical protein
VKRDPVPDVGHTRQAEDFFGSQSQQFPSFVGQPHLAPQSQYPFSPMGYSPGYPSMFSPEQGGQWDPEESELLTQISRLEMANTAMKSEIEVQKHKIQVLEQQLYCFFQKLAILERGAENVPEESADLYPTRH